VCVRSTTEIEGPRKTNERIVPYVGEDHGFWRFELWKKKSGSKKKTITTKGNSLEAVLEHEEKKEQS